MADSENLTPEETQQLDSGDTATGEEEHRYAEFEDLRDRIEALTDLVRKQFEGVTRAIGALSVNTGVSDVVDMDGDGDRDSDDLEQMAELERTKLEDLDFSL